MAIEATISTRVADQTLLIMLTLRTFWQRMDRSNGVKSQSIGTDVD
jgi:hypothetical protein